jgi:hypothetical protein
VARITTVLWRTPPPTSVDEELAVYDDGSAWLAVRASRDGLPTIGSWSTDTADDDRAVFAAAGEGPLLVDLLHPADTGPLGAVAERVAAAARDSAIATATFHAGVTGAGAGVSLLVVAAGSRPVRFDLDPASCSVHVGHDGSTLAWYEVLPFGTGFVTPDAAGLGGVGRVAEVAPGSYGAIALDVPTLAAKPDGATEVAIQIAGWLHDALPDHPMPEPFAVRTAAVPFPAS